MNAEIPDKVIAYNIYTNGVKLGVTGKVDILIPKVVLQVV